MADFILVKVAAGHYTSGDRRFQLRREGGWWKVDDHLTGQEFSYKTLRAAREKLPIRLEWEAANREPRGGGHPGPFGGPGHAPRG